MTENEKPPKKIKDEIVRDSERDVNNLLRRYRNFCTRNGSTIEQKSQSTKRLGCNGRSKKTASNKTVICYDASADNTIHKREVFLFSKIGLKNPVRYRTC